MQLDSDWTDAVPAPLAISAVLRCSSPFFSTSFLHFSSSSTATLQFCFLFPLLSQSKQRSSESHPLQCCAQTQSRFTIRQQHRAGLFSLAHHLIPSISSFSLCIAGVTLEPCSHSLTFTSLRSGDLPSHTHRTLASHALALCAKCRYQSTPLCRFVS